MLILWRGGPQTQGHTLARGPATIWAQQALGLCQYPLYTVGRPCSGSHQLPRASVPLPRSWGQPKGGAAAAGGAAPLPSPLQRLWWWGADAAVHGENEVGVLQG